MHWCMRSAARRRMMAVAYHNFPRFSVDKNPSMADEFVKISVKGMKANQKATLHASTTLAGGAMFESYAHYTSDHDGCIALDKHPSDGGTYTGIEPMGLLWSLIPSWRNERINERFILKEPKFPFVIKLRLYDTYIKSLEEVAKHSPNDEFSITRWYLAPGTEEVDVKVGRIRGTLYIPPGKGPFPGVMSMSGGYPGAMKHKASLLASHGFAALALKYFGVDDLPDSFIELDLEYFEEAAKFLADHPRVDGRPGVGIVSNCFATSLGYSLACVAPPGLINCFVSVSGYFFLSSYVKYKEKNYVPYGGIMREETEYPDGSVELFHTAADVKDVSEFENSFFGYPRENTECLVIGGGRDANIDVKKIADVVTSIYPSDVRGRMHVHHYPDAGHLIEHAYSPHAKVAWTLGQMLYCGGIQPEHERAQEDSWQKIIEFLSNRLLTRKSNL